MTFTLKQPSTKEKWIRYFKKIHTTSRITGILRKSMTTARRVALSVKAAKLIGLLSASSRTTPLSNARTVTGNGRYTKANEN